MIEQYDSWSFCYEGYLVCLAYMTKIKRLLRSILNEDFCTFECARTNSGNSYSTSFLVQIKWRF